MMKTEHLDTWAKATGQQSMELHTKLVNEEIWELGVALDEWSSLDCYSYRHERDLFKECLDVLWVVIGFCKEMGWDIDQGFEELADSNLSKLVDGKFLRREDGKILKGPNYHEPNLLKAMLGDKGKTDAS